jgi:hypothetical protein
MSIYNTELYIIQNDGFGIRCDWRNKKWKRDEEMTEGWRRGGDEYI